MANLIGYLQGNRGQASRLGSSTIYSELETWQGSITTSLDKDGNFTVHIGPKSNANTLIASGNVNDLSASVYGSDETFRFREQPRRTIHARTTIEQANYL